jgi:hypothetical protein
VTAQDVIDRARTIAATAERQAELLRGSDEEVARAIECASFTLNEFAKVVQEELNRDPT